MRVVFSFIRRLNARRRAKSGEEKNDAPRSFLQRVKGWLYYGAYLMFSVLGIWLALELVLAIGHVATGSTALETLDTDENYAVRLYPDYPENPSSYTKIAVFGGSTAAGHGSTRPFSAVVEYELKKRFPNHKIFVKNYAQRGYPFHRHQAEYVKRLIDKYDFFLIYCGNNEADNWFDDSGYWRHSEYKDAKELVFRRPVEARSQLLNALEKYSRLFALVTRAKGRVQTIQAPISKNKASDYHEFEPADALPPEERKAIVTNFEQDVVEIGELARQHNKQILLSVTATHETWPPCFSFFRPDISEQEKRQWHEIYQGGMAELDNANWQAAIAAFQRAGEIDSGVAILNYQLGMCYLKLNEPEKGRQFLRQAIDQDGFHSRSITALHDKAKELCNEYDSLHYVDCVDAIHQVLRGDIADEELFIDIHHMKLLGHVVVGRTFLDELVKLKPFRNWDSVAFGGPEETDWRQLGEYYHRELGVTKSQDAMESLSRINFFFQMSQWTAYREHCYKQIDEQIRRFEQLLADDRGEQSRVIAKLSRARVAVARGDNDLATQRLNEALAISPAELQKALGWAAWNHYVIDEFENAAIVYVKEKGRFVSMKKPTETPR